IRPCPGPAIHALPIDCALNMWLVESRVIQGADVSRLTNTQKEDIDIVLKAYKDKSPQYLVALSHSEQPWKDSRVGYDAGERCNNEIKDDAIAEYYSSLP
ncbi:MAG: DUF4065 domain-containing protein, partial [Desulfovibrio sp.]|nr:DUF4065 domain-containing protein [Desulfovibrio sp.]